MTQQFKLEVGELYDVGGKKGWCFGISSKSGCYLVAVLNEPNSPFYYLANGIPRYDGMYPVITRKYPSETSETKFTVGSKWVDEDGVILTVGDVIVDFKERKEWCWFGIANHRKYLDSLKPYVEPAPNHISQTGKMVRQDGTDFAWNAFKPINLPPVEEAKSYENIIKSHQIINECLKKIEATFSSADKVISRPEPDHSGGGNEMALDELLDKAIADYSPELRGVVRISESDLKAFLKELIKEVKQSKGV